MSYLCLIYIIYTYIDILNIFSPVANNNFTKIYLSLHNSIRAMSIQNMFDLHIEGRVRKRSKCILRPFRSQPSICYINITIKFN